MWGVGGGGEDFEIAESGGIHEESVVGAVFTDAREIFRRSAEVLCGVVDEGAGGTEGRVLVGDADGQPVAKLYNIQFKQHILNSLKLHLK